MTGYGKAAGKVKSSILNVEIRSLNSKSLEVGLRLSNRIREKEAEIRSIVAEKIQRGKIDLMIVFESATSEGAGVFNKKIIRDYVKELKNIAGELNLKNENLLQYVLTLPEAVGEEKLPLSEKEWKQVFKIISNATDEFQKFRIKEGKSIEKDLALRVKEILKLMKDIEKHEPERILQVRERLYKQLTGLDEVKIDKNRFEQELIYYIERMDITEEKIRLQSHCEHFTETMNSENQNGKKLGFISQEMGREINTIGAKASDAKIQKIVVQMKDELEKIKEQLANVL